MSKRYSGALITKTPVVPTSLSAPGVWSLSDQAAAQATNTWPFPRDPQFNYVTMLLHGDGSAGPVAATGVGAGVSTTVTNFNADASTNNFNVTINGDARSDNFTPYLGNGYYSYSGNGSTTYALAPNSTAFDQNAAFTLEWYDFLISNGAAQAPFYVNTSGYLTVYRQAAGGYQLDKSGTGSLYLSSAYSFSAWHYIAISYDGTSTRMYVDGVLLYTYAGGGVACGTTPELGRGNGGINVNGYISNLRFTKSALYTGSTMTVPTTPLTAITNCTFLAFQSNRFIDNSTNNLAITTFNSPAISPAIPFTLPSSVATYGSGYFDGTGDRLVAPANAVFNFSTGDFTVECWVYLNSVSANQWIVGPDDTTTYPWALQTVGSAIRFISNNAANIFSPTSFTLTTGTWNHFAVTRSGSTMRWFTNGTLNGSQTYSTAIGSNTINVQIGTTGSGSGDPVNGYITDLRVVKGTAVYTASFTPSTTPLTAITNTSLLTTQYNGGGNNSGFKDSSQFNFPITRNGNTTQGTFTPYGSNWSNYFDGTSSWNLASASSTAFAFGSGGAWAFEAWVFPTASMTDNWVIQTTDSGNMRLRITTGGVLGWYSDTYGGGLNSSTVVPVNSWSHVAATYDGSTLRLFQNGVLTTSLSSGSITNGTTAVSAYIGNWSGGSRAFNGYISNARIVKGSAVYTAAFTPNTTPLTAISGTSLLTCQSNRFVDTSSNAFAITVNGSPSVQRFSPFAPLTVYNPTTYGGSGYFDGSSDYLSAPNNVAFNLNSVSFTVECWIYWNSISGEQNIVEQFTPASGPGWTLYKFSAGTIDFYGGTASINSGVTPVTGQWYHLAISRNNTTGTTSFYVNGTRTATATFGVASTSATELLVGVRKSGATWFNGYMEDLRIVKGTYIYDPTATTITVPTAPLTAVANTNFLLNYTNPAILDNSMLNNLETVGNAAVSTSVKKYGAASIAFDGTGDYLLLQGGPNFTFGTGDFTIEMWIYVVSGLSADIVYYDGRPTSTNGLYNIIYTNSTGKLIYNTNSADRITGTTTLSTGTWYHIAVCRSGTSTKLFLSGAQEGSTYTDSNSYIVGANRPVIGGNGYTLGNAPLNGYIDDLRITKYARYTTTFTVPDQAFPNG